MATLVIDAGDFLRSFDRALGRIDVKVQTAVADTVADVHEVADGLVPVDTGELQRSIYDETRRTARQVVGTFGTRGCKHAVINEFGSQPHDIVPVRAKALHWSNASGEHFARRVHHPGTRPAGWFRASWARAPGLFRRHVAGQFGGRR